MFTSEVLHKAADLIEERGWARGGGWLASGPLCLEGGIVAALGHSPLSEAELCNGILTESQTCPAYRAVQSFLTESRAPGRFLWMWNDHYARNAAEVIEVLRAAAAVEELKEAEARGPLNTGPTVRVPTQPGVGVA